MGIILILVVAGIVYVLFTQGKEGGRGFFSIGPAPVRVETPLDTLNKRYARGEINRSEFEEKKRDLQEER